MRGRHANAAIGAFGAIPCGATQCVRGVPKIGTGPPCERCHWGLRWNLLRAAKRVRVCQHGCGAAMRTLPLRPS
eukprot:7754878-Pyramimonas_sp.AAC.1